MTDNRSDTDPVDDPPRSWGPLEILERLSADESSAVYRARHSVLERDFELKLFETRDEDEQSRLLGEGRTMLRIRHPNIVQVAGAELHQGLVGIWSEMVAGETLAEIVEHQGPLTPDTTSGIGHQLCSALAAIHDAELLCPQLNLESVIREREGAVRLNYFASNTGESAVAPELSDGGECARASDIYALGGLLYRLATGVFPAPGDGGGLPEQLMLCLDRAVATSPNDRFQTAGDFGSALARAGRRPASRARRIAGVFIILSLSVLVIVQWPSQYRLESTLYRVGQDDSLRRLAAGEPVVVGDCLALDVETTMPMYVYVFSENRMGGATGRFPQANSDAENPLAPDLVHTVSATRGRGRCWQVERAGDFARLHILASPEPVPEFKEMYLALPQAGVSEAMVAPLIETARELDESADAAIGVSYSILELGTPNSD